MNNRERGERYRRYVGLELKGAIQSRGRTAKDVAEEIGRADENFNRWLNDKKPLPTSVLCLACEAIGIEPKIIAERAYDRMVSELGEPDQQDQSADVIHHDFGRDTVVNDPRAAASDSADTTENDQDDQHFFE